MKFIINENQMELFAPKLRNILLKYISKTYPEKMSKICDILVTVDTDSEGVSYYKITVVGEKLGSTADVRGEISSFLNQTPIEFGLWTKLEKC